MRYQSKYLHLLQEQDILGLRKGASDHRDQNMAREVDLATECRTSEHPFGGRISKSGPKVSFVRII
jgi:hypothetical protein